MHFEKVNYKAFEHDMMQYKPMVFLDGTAREAYDKIELPERKTKYSCGYDVRTPVTIRIAPGCSVVVPTGIKVVMSEDEMETWCLKLYARSGIGIKDKVVITNSVGLIDGDFQFSDNDGDMLIALTNMSGETKRYDAGTRICQAVFEIYGKTSNDKASGKRSGGVGSTGQE